MQKMFYKKNKLYNELYDAIGFNRYEKSIISIIGGGGKTTTFSTLIDEFLARNKKVICMTSTNMFYPEKKVFSDISDEFLNAIENDNEIWIGRKVINQHSGRSKLTTPHDEMINFSKKTSINMIVEADGSKGKPLKLQREHEPAILTDSNIVISIVGLDAYNKPIKDVGFKCENVARYLNKELEDLVTIDDIVNIVINKEKGLTKGVEKNMEHIILLNKVDNDELFNIGCEIADLLSPKTVILAKQI